MIIKNNCSKTYFVLYGIALMIALAFMTILSGCGNSSVYKESTHIQELSVSKVYEKLKAKEDFFVFFGDRTDQACINFECSLANKLDKLDKDIYYMDTVVDDEDFKILEIIWEYMGFLEEEDVKEVLHISNGYRIKGYPITMKKKIKEFYHDFSEDDTDLTGHVECISPFDFSEKVENGEELWTFFGRPTCSSCTKRYGQLVMDMKDKENCNIQYVLVGKDLISEEEVKEITRIQQLYGAEEVPMVYHVKDGKLVKAYSITYKEEFETLKSDFFGSKQ